MNWNWRDENEWKALGLRACDLIERWGFLADLGIGPLLALLLGLKYGLVGVLCGVTFGLWLGGLTTVADVVKCPPEKTGMIFLKGLAAGGFGVALFFLLLFIGFLSDHYRS